VSALPEREPALVAPPLPAWLGEGSEPLVLTSPSPDLPEWLLADSAATPAAEPEPLPPLPDPTVPLTPPTPPSTSPTTPPRPRVATFSGERPGKARVATRRGGWRRRVPWHAVAAAVVFAATLLGALALLPPPQEDLPSPDVVRAYSAIDRLKPEAAVLVIFDYSEAQAAALRPAEQSILRHLAAREARIVAVTTESMLPVEWAAAELGGRLTSLGRVATSSETARRLGGRERPSGAPSDPALRRATHGRPLELIIVVAAEAGSAARWLGTLRPGGNPPAIAVIAAGDDTTLAPLRGGGQLVGAIRSPAEVPGYATLAGAGMPPARSGGMLAGLAVALVSVAGLAAVGGLGSKRANAETDGMG